MLSNMNKLDKHISKIDMLFGLFISIIIMFITSLKIAIIFLLGVSAALINYLLSSFFIKKYLVKNSKLIIISTIVRIILVSSIIILFISDVKLILTYILGFIAHYISLIYCTLFRKGSA